MVNSKTTADARTSADTTYCDSCEKYHNDPEEIVMCDPAAVYAELESCMQLFSEADDRHLRVRMISGAQAMLARLLQLESAEMARDALNRAAS